MKIGVLKYFNVNNHVWLFLLERLITKLINL